MARPEKTNVDYFPFYCEDGNKMFYLEETYGNDGFATFVKLLRELARANNHYLDLSKPSTMMFLSAKCKISREVLEAIVNDLVELGKFDRMLWTENRVIWCEDFTKSIQDAYSKRNNNCITYDGLISLLISLGVRKHSKDQSTSPVNTQSIVEYSKVDKTKGDNSKGYSSDFSNPHPQIDFEKLILFFNENRGQMAEVVKITPARKNKLKAILRSNSKEDLKKVILTAKESEFIQGKNDRQWIGSFDWLVKPENFVKTLEGNYNNKQKPQQNGKPTFAKNR